MKNKKLRLFLYLQSEYVRLAEGVVLHEKPPRNIIARIIYLRAYRLIDDGLLYIAHGIIDVFKQ